MNGAKAADTNYIPYEMFAAVDESDDRAILKHWRHEAQRQLDEMRAAAKSRLRY